jgi:hypothetical protein
VTIGNRAGGTQGDNAIAIGNYAGVGQATQAISIGNLAGFTTQKLAAIAIGYKAGKSNQSNNSVSIGNTAGGYYQAANAIAIGYKAGRNFQGKNSVVIGYKAGYVNTLTGQSGPAIPRTDPFYSIAIGNKAGYSQVPYSIALNATTGVLNTTSSGFFVKPIATTTSSSLNTLVYNSTTNEIAYNTTKTFVIQHPTDQEKYLVHACLEGPEAGVYYRGTHEITNDKSVIVELPKYVDKIAKNFSVMITKIWTEDSSDNSFAYQTSTVKDNMFTVYGKNGSFYWTVFGERESINVEVDKKDFKLQNFGPYTFLENK